jgi:Flp pilus assembly protein TadD
VTEADSERHSGAARPDKGRGSGLLWMVGLAVLAVGVHASTLFAGFAFDDNFNIELRGTAAWSHIASFFTTNQSAFYGSNFYRPIVNLWCEGAYALFGTNAMGWHSLSLLLHVVCTLLVFRLAAKVVERREVAVTAAALYAVHPAHVEVISWIAAVADSLMTAFLLVSVLCFIRWMQQGRVGWWIASLAAAVACTLSKEPAVMLPLVLLVTAAALRPTARPGLPVLRSTIPFFAIPVVFLAVRNAVLQTFSHAATPAGNAEMFYTLPAALLFYLRHLLWPSAVVPFYPVAMVPSWRSGEFLVPLAMVLAATAAMGYLLVRSAGVRRSCLCAVWIVAPLAPALYLKVFPPMELVHDRFLYAPLVGFCIAAALVLHHLAEVAAAKLGVRLFVPAAVALVVLMSLHSASEMLWWRNNRTLFAHALTVTPNSQKALDGLAAAYIVRGDFPAAVPLLERSLQINPRNSRALFCIARMAWMQRDYDRAGQYLRKAIRVKPRYDMWLHLASVEMHRNQIDEAEHAARQALAMRSSGLGAHATLGAVLLAKGEREEAASEFRRELRNYPQNDVARKGLAQATAGPSE